MFVSEYLCIVKFIQKNTIFGLLLLVGILLNYNTHFEYSDVSSSIELTAENNSTSNGFISDSEILEEDQIICATEFLSFVEKNNKHNHSLVTSLFSTPFFTVWQPPNLS